MWWFIGFIVLMIVGCFCIYKSAEVHELHKIRAAFENKKHDIENLIKGHKSDSNFNIEYYKGELKEIDELENILDIEINGLKLYDLKRFGID